MSAPNIIYPPSSGGGGGISGSGTAGKLVKFTTTSTVGDSLLSESGTTITSAATAQTFSSAQTWTLASSTTALNIQSGLLNLDTTNNRVGFGCTDPATLIETYGTTGIRASSDTVANVGVFQYTTDATPATLTLRKARGTRAAQTTVATGDTMGSVNFTAYGGTSGSVLSSISGNVVTYTSNANISSNLTFGTSASGAATPTTRLTIDEAGVSTFTGPVRATGTTASVPAFTGSDTDTGLYFPAANQVRLSTNATPALAIDASQNVGIANQTGTILGRLHVGSGTTAPVVTTPGLIVTGTTSEARLVVKESTVGAEWFVLPSTTQVSMGNVNAYNLEIKTSNAARLIVGSTGIVTVGATAGSTTSTLDVSTSGWGVKLNGSPTNIDGNTLDAYEEGTWTPVDRSGASLSFTAVSGTYTRIGRTVIAQCTLTYPSTANASDASFSLPIAMTTASTNFGGATIGSVGALVKNNVTALIKTGATPATDHRIALITYNGAGTVTNANMSLVTIVVSVCYNVA